MEKKKVADLYQAVDDEGQKIMVEQLLPDVAKTVGGVLVNESVGALIGGILGAVCPTVNNIRMSYRQNRLERNVKSVLLALLKRQDELEVRIGELQKTNPKCLRNVTEALLDNTVDEIQEKKIEYNINGYANILNGSEVNEDFSLTFFKTLAQLNELDIRILRCYAGYMGDGGESVQDICENTGIDYTQVRFVKEKLSRYGLLQSRNEEINDKNMESMVKYMQDVERESHKSKPKDVKVPKLKKPFGTDSYSITMLGRRYLALMQL